MLLLSMLTGLLTGWILNWASDYLPRFAIGKNKTVTPAPASYPATFSLLMKSINHKAGQSQQWFWLHIIVEWSSIAMLSFLWWRLGMTAQALVLFASFAFLLLVAVIDIKYRLILNVMVYPAMLVVLLFPVVQPHPSTLQMSLGGILVFSIFGLTAWLKPGQLGGGDIKLAIMIGFMFGFPQVLTALLIGSGAGASVAITMLLSGRYTRKSTIPYAPFLCLGAMIALIYNPILG